MLILPNLHTHIPRPDAHWHILNVHEQFDARLPAVCSAGLHPWFIDATTWKAAFSQLTDIAQQTQVIAIGECGLDTLCTTSFDLQKTVFASHIELANALNKPLIIHAVRTHTEIVQMLQEVKVRVPVIFHGFNRNKHIAGLLLEHNYYLSFGKALFNPAVSKVFRHVPAESVFMETDHDPILIEEVYREASKIRGESITKFVQQIHQNYFRVFGIEFT